MTPSQDPLVWLFGLEQFGIKLGLSGITAILDALGRPERGYRSLHVAGTNGKGSVAAIVDAALRAAGHRSALYTSPHLVNLTERFVVQGRPVESGALVSVVGAVRATVDRLLENGALVGMPTFFEVTTAVAFELFRQERVEVAVCEVGLGGRLDATNVLVPDVAVITSIGFDHVQHLGTTLDAIAREKAGIVKTGAQVVVGELPGEAAAAVEAVARVRGARLTRAADGVAAEPIPGGGAGRQRMRLRTPAYDYGTIELALAGRHQVSNAVVAVRTLEALAERGLPIDPAAIRDGLRLVRWPGRLDLRRLPEGREILLDAAHNPDGAAALATYLQDAGLGRPPLVFGTMRDKDTAGMLRLLAPAVGAVVATSASTARAADPSDVARVAREVAPSLPVAIRPSMREALAAAWALAPRIVAAGSLHLLGDVIEELRLPVREDVRE
jgi:dihydrofolate synthase/folylpolyglutamate synthase